MNTSKLCQPALEPDVVFQQAWESLVGLGRNPKEIFQDDAAEILRQGRFLYRDPPFLDELR